MNFVVEKGGQIAYEAYAAYTGSKLPVAGEQLPKWAELNDEMKASWKKLAYTLLLWFDSIRDSPPPISL
jgi:hypothetical protein